MRRPPRTAGSLLPGRRETTLAVARGLFLTAAVLALFLRALPSGEETARGLAVTTLVLGQTLLVLTARAGLRAPWRDLGTNRILPFVLAASVATAWGVPAMPGLAEVFHMRALDPSAWAVAAVVAAVAVLAPEVFNIGPLRSSRP